MEHVDTLIGIVNSKEMEKLSKCAERNCAKFFKLLEKEKDVIAKIAAIRSEMKKVDNTKSLDMKALLARAGEMIRLSKELSMLYTQKDALVCGYRKCGNEVADLHTQRNRRMVKILEKQEKEIPISIRRVEQMQKKKDKN